MSHELESMFYFGEVPWHGLGTPVQEALTSRDALVESGLNWVVEKMPLQIAGTEIVVPDTYSIVRTKDMSVLGTVKQKYKMVQNFDAFDWTDQLLGSGVRYETAGSLLGGKVVWLLARMPQQLRLADDPTDVYACFTNTHDGSGAVRVFVTPIRVVCKNTLTFALEDAERILSVRHTGDIKSKIMAAASTLELTDRYIRNLTVQSERYAEFKVPVQDLVTQLLQVPEGDPESKKVANAQLEQEKLRFVMERPDLKQYEGTAWQFLNGVADYAYHRKLQKERETWRDRRMLEALNGADILSQAQAIIDDLLVTA